MEIRTETSCVLPILGCLQAAKDYLKTPNAWNTVNARQKDFLSSHEQFIDRNLLLSVRELMARADKDFRVINAWLKSQGFDIQLDVVDENNSFAVASILKVLVEWLEVGKITSLLSYGQKGEFSAVKLNKGVRVFENLTLHKHPIARIETKSGDKVSMTIIDKNPVSLLSTIRMLNMVTRISRDYDGVTFPMISLDERPDISWICGMTLDGNYISQALQQTKFRMNEIGAKVESAAAMSVSKGISINPPPMVIDRPFLLWIERDGLSFPIFSAVLAEDCWKKPESL